MLPLGARVRALFLVALLVGASAIVVGGDVLGFSSGINEQIEREGGGTTTLLQGGCSCHNPQFSPGVMAVLEGVPSFYAFNGQLQEGPFDLTVRIAGGPNVTAGRNQGGFNLQVSQGTLSAPPGAADVQVLDNEATHSSSGNKQREWRVRWAPPAEAGPDAVFTLTVNSVNGNGFNDPGDEWGRATFVAMGAQRLGAAPPGGDGGVHAITALGVNFFAYWVGVVSFIVLFVVLAATFFLLRYGESSHWTDQKDRPARDAKAAEGAPKAAMGTWVVLALVLIVFVVAAVQVIRVV